MPRKKALKEQGKKEKKPMQLWPLYLILLALIVLYSVQNNIIVGIAAFVVFIIIIVLILKEVKEEVQVKGGKQSIKEIAMVIAAVIIIWVGLIVILQTTSPINAVASCSMLPYLQRGDGIVLHGISNFTQFAKSNHVPVVNLSPQQFDSLQSNIGNEFLSYYAYLNSNKSAISTLLPVNANVSYGIGLYNNQCLAKYQETGQLQGQHFCYVGSNPASNLIKYNYSIGTLSLSGINYKTIITSQITINNTKINDNYSNPIIVYQTTPQDSFSGAIIHRLVAMLYVNGTYYTLTKGDNNPALDMQFDNYPASQSEVLGYVLARIPLLGYAKLIISGQLAQPAGCNQVITQH